ncbi:Hypothetical protein, putative [Bodo saltans]|uniref:Uncharacterized protein n=1 Tax=Bodo saltans TaxID=75058 RepID=A0A0S4JQT3_BODSA|nr:Hypothetical protein, putative [Bodo saltans]|eukprot:CUG91722.1 Hypothetical protein, putative [Bodo saltans]
MSSLVDTTPAPLSSSSKRATSSASEPIEGHKCFMCGIVCADAGDLDTHVIRCAKGQLSSARRRGEEAGGSGTITGPTGHTTSEPGHVGVHNGGLREQQDVASEPPSTVPSHDVSFEAPPRRLSQHSAPDDHLNISQHGTNGELHEVSRGVSDGPLPHDVVVATVVRTDDQDHNEDVGSPNVSTMDQTLFFFAADTKQWDPVTPFEKASPARK